VTPDKKGQNKYKNVYTHTHNPQWTALMSTNGEAMEVAGDMSFNKTNSSTTPFFPG